jgi:hypothetical protein
VLGRNDGLGQGAGRDFDPALFEVFLGMLPTIRAIRDNHTDEDV